MVISYLIICVFFMYGDVAALQVRCFSAPLQPTEISGIKRVQEKMPEGVNDNTLTLIGFLFLHALFIDKRSYGNCMYYIEEIWLGQ